MRRFGLALTLVLLIVTAGCRGNNSNPTPAPLSDPDGHADWLIAQMSQAEKLQLVHGFSDTMSFPRGGAGYVPGIPRLGIPDLYLVDGSVGVGNSVGQATALPSSIASAASWDLNEAYKYGQVIGKEMRAYGVNVNLGGNINLIGREPRDGRTFETKGEDPTLAGRITAAHLRAIQDLHVLAGIKHYALNDQETGRGTANVIIDERGARESDLLAFEIGVKDSKVQSVMCSYNLVNGTYACENSHLLSDILKGDWGFQGFVMSDWWATHASYVAANAGLDQEQPGDDNFSLLPQALANGQLTAARLNNMVHRILRAMLAVGIFDYPETVGPIDSSGDAAIAQEAEEQGAVLLKNAGGLLPLNASSISSIAVIGSHADVAVLSGGGSAQVTPVGGPALTFPAPCPPCWGSQIWDPSSPLQAIQAMAPGVVVSYNDGTDFTSAAALAAASNVAIVFVSEWESEGMDLTDLNFSNNQDALVAAVAAANPHTIVVLENGGAQVMPWLANVSAVLEAWYPGQKGGEAIANILFGKVNPSGKLPITFPASVSDLPHPTIATPPDQTTPFPVSYTEGFNVGYKWYDANGLTPLFPFGFGLSYTSFAFSNQQLTPDTPATSGFQVSFDLTNTGLQAGAEVAQVYLGLPSSTGEPPKRLVGWQKVILPPQQMQSITMTVDANDSSHPLSYWDAGSNSWQIAAGEYSVYLGNSSHNITLIGTFQVSP